MTILIRRIIFILSVCVFCMPSIACETAEGCAKLFPLMADSSPGINKEQQELAEKIQEFGFQAAPFLMDMLKSDDEGLLDLVTYTLANVQWVDESHLDAFMGAWERGGGWIPPAIARIGGDRAIEYLIDEAIQEGHTSNQIGVAFRVLGAESIPYLLKRYRCISDCDEKELSVLSRVFGDISENSQKAINPLMEIAENTGYQDDARKAAVRALASIGEAVQVVESRLYSLGNREPRLFKGAVAIALVDIKSSLSTESLKERLSATQDMYLFREIAELGENGKALGPQLVQHLGSKNKDIRYGAAQALGYVGFKPAAQKLEESLKDPDDWRLVYAASKALGRLQATEAIDSLVHVEKFHWYPPVQKAAARAIELIQSGSKSGVDHILPPAFQDFFAYQSVGQGIEACSKISLSQVTEPITQKAYRRNWPEKLGQLKYPMEPELVAWPVDEPEPESHAIQRVPDVALKVDGGWLAGSDRGEFDGELMFFSDDKKPELLARENVEDIYAFSSEYIVVGGLAHLGINNGRIYRLNRDQSGVWNLRIWKILPGAPYSSFLTEDGRVLINSYGGSLLLSESGEIEMAECLEE